MNDTVHTEKIGTIRIEVWYDQDGGDEWCNPRKHDGNLGTMYCFHDRYSLGDRDKKGKELMCEEEVQELVKQPNTIHLPLHLYDHSGITMRTGSFNAIDPGGWDSGCVGVIVTTHEKAREVLGLDVTPEEKVSEILSGEPPALTPEQIEQVVKSLESEVDIYDQYIRGEIYGFTIFDEEADDEEVESCGGFLGDYEEYLMDEARSIAEHYIERRSQKKAKTIPAFCADDGGAYAEDEEA